MKLAIISDTHFGDPTSRLVTPSGGTYVPGADFKGFCEAAGTGNDYLVLLGDLFDFAVASWEEAYAAGTVFFREVRERGIAREVIYLPGNHDFDFLHVAMHEANVVNRIKRGRAPTSRWTVPGLLDDKDSNGVLELPNVSARAGTPRYGGLFLDDLGASRGQPKLTVNLVYPNLYLRMPSGTTLMMTHGHYFEPYWSLTLQLARQIARDDLVLGAENRPTMKDIVSVNFPLNLLGSSGIGQAGALTRIVRLVQREYKDGKFDRIRLYVKRARDYADDLLRYKWYQFYKEVASDLCLDAVQKHVLQTLESSRDPARGTRRAAARNNSDFLASDDVKKRLDEYLFAVPEELHYINDALGNDVPFPSELLFGHTHCPMLVGSSAAEKHPIPGGSLLQLYNTGGWLRPGTSAVFTYESDRGLGSTLV